MRLHVVAHGRIGRGPEADLVDRYLKRITWPLTLTELSDAGSGKVADLPSPAVTILLDERGTALTSRAFADRLAGWRDDGMREARFVIGPADGHGETARANAGLLLSFGPATWPHLLVRGMLAEQLYRATSLLAGHPYHRDG
ncbi:23S rRNA (pseudouridine(1915)-N(3))-methyltransferase RlmH [Polymorphobacter sp. PAMC 29334]|uniref:23S rRNA (pseudouridine(1915)-N(3))-methyltransferase RlmH n=1 Tax=Polymorphobacter sp. PAMC 29334 TaxID=2862331 RepID=UPI001C684030|nr:23S rRNA (pseudouridine(1915)-N(3))-methyltransferase RlmH [Polymorphobacter sp. PAMC 29334]QYE35267.1 23S rRNA (pseudouridine(1915)-N(3))-methyltransferase RlmH [Polymorphobacter sp. PAMC 29334]